MLLDLLGGLVLFALLVLLLLGERVFERGRARVRRRQLAAPRRERRE